MTSKKTARVRAHVPHTPPKKPVRGHGETVCTPRMLVFWHGHGDGEEAHFSHALVWVERQVDPPEVLYVHVLKTDEVKGVAYWKRPGHEYKFMVETRVSTTAKQFEDYLRGRLARCGNVANAEVYRLLGVEKPAILVEATRETAHALVELYERAAKAMETTTEDLQTRYGHLNPGLQAMNLRNRLRARGAAV